MKKNHIRRILLVSALVTGAFSLVAHADIYKCVGDSGIPAFVDGKTKVASNYKNCVLFIRDNSAPGNSGASSSIKSGRQSQTKTATPADFPRVDRQTQSQLDNTRKEILKQELETEKRALEEAKQAHAEGESNPEIYKKSKQVVVKNKDGSNSTKTVTDTFRNVPKYEEKMQKLQSDVDLHEKNIELLQKELGSTK